MRTIFYLTLASSSLIGCSFAPTEAQLREKSFRSTARLALDMAQLHVDNCRTMDTGESAIRYANDMKEKCSQCPDIRYDDHLGYVMHGMESITKYFEIVADSHKTIASMKAIDPNHAIIGGCREDIERCLTKISQIAKNGLNVLDGQIPQQQPLIN